MASGASDEAVSAAVAAKNAAFAELQEANAAIRKASGDFKDIRNKNQEEIAQEATDARKKEEEEAKKAAEKKKKDGEKDAEDLKKQREKEAEEQRAFNLTVALAEMEDIHQQNQNKLDAQAEQDQALKDIADLHIDEVHIKTAEEIKADEDLAKSSENVKEAKKNALNESLNILSAFAGKNKALAIGILAVQKGLAIAEIVTNAAKGIAVSQSNLSAVPVILPGTFVPNPAFPVALAAHVKNVLATKINAAAGIASILAQTISAASNTLKGGDTGGATPGGGGSAGASQAASFNLVAQTPANQTVLGGRESVVKAQVVSTEVSSAQALDRNRVEQSIFL